VNAWEERYGESEVYKLERHVFAVGRCPRVVRNDRYGTKRNGHLSARPGLSGSAAPVSPQRRSSSILLTKRLLELALRASTEERQDGFGA
jgi:hypothetical protein